MKRFIFGLALILGLAGVSNATSSLNSIEAGYGISGSSIGISTYVASDLLQRPVYPVTGVAFQYSSTITVIGVSVSGTSGSGTSIVSSTSTGFRSLEIYNLATAATMYCAERPTVSTTSGLSVGFPVEHGTEKEFVIVPFTNFYCVNDSGSAQWAAVRRSR